MNGLRCFAATLKIGRHDAAPARRRELGAQVGDGLVRLRDLAPQSSRVEAADAEHVDEVEGRVAEGEPRRAADVALRRVRSEDEPQAAPRLAAAGAGERVGEAGERPDERLRGGVRQRADERADREHGAVFEAPADGMRLAGHSLRSPAG